MIAAAPHLTTLPPELLLIISEHLDAYELVRLSRTCRALHHLCGCKSVAKAFMRSGTADDAIKVLRDKVNRMDTVVELFRHVKNRKASYPDVAEIAARLNDMEQLEAWRAEFGFISPIIYFGAARSARIETFDYILPHVKLDGHIADAFFVIIGDEGNRMLLDHLRTKYPDLVTPERLKKVVVGSAESGRLDFAVDVFESMSPHSGLVIAESAGYIAKGAAENGNSALFAKFIDMFQYHGFTRDAMATSAAANDHANILRIQEESENPAYSFEAALEIAVQNNAFDAFQYILKNDDIVTRGLYYFDFGGALRSVMALNRTDMFPLLVARAPSICMLSEAAKAESLDMALTLLGGYMGFGEDHVWNCMERKVEFDDYTDALPDWKMTIWLIIIGFDSDAQSEKYYINDAERARYLSVLPAAIDLARKLVTASCR
jgi:hypothetical protein